MKIKHSLFTSFGFLFMLLFSSSLYGQELEPIKLLKPQISGGKPLMQVLQERQSQRSFSSTKLPLQVLSDLLWAAWGVNRPESGKRTAPSAANFQEIDIYVALAEGLYLYNAQDHILMPVMAKDIRAETGLQDFVKDVPVNLIFVADYARMRKTTEGNLMLSAVSTGYISQNVYLFCASEGLATVARGMVDRESLKKLMNLRPDQNITFTQSIGYPKE
jgi:SagB-type dehydrogenase family enzyme